MPCRSKGYASACAAPETRRLVQELLFIALLLQTMTAILDKTRDNKEKQGKPCFTGSIMKYIVFHTQADGEHESYTESCRENAQNRIDFYEYDRAGTSVYDEQKQDVTEEFRFVR